MPDLVLHKVEMATRTAARYRDHAAPESMDVYLRDWVKASRLLARRIADLDALRAERLAARARGEWPPRSTEPGTPSKEDERG